MPLATGAAQQFAPNPSSAYLAAMFSHTAAIALTDSNPPSKISADTSGRSPNQTAWISSPSQEPPSLRTVGVPPFLRRKRMVGKPIPLEDRFWSKVTKTETCWIWTASKMSSGYGRIVVHKRGVWGAHRASYYLATGVDPADKVVDHLCHVKVCVNPDHLRLVTSKQNSEHRRGANSNSASGVLGVSWDKRSRKWAASVRHNGRGFNVGLLDSILEAREAVTMKRLELFSHNDMDKRELQQGVTS